MLYLFIVFLLLLFGQHFMCLCLNNSNFEFKQMIASSLILTYKMISTEKVVKIKVVKLIKYNNFYFGHLFMSLNLNNSNFEFQEMTASNKNLTHQMISDEKVMNIKVIVLIKVYNFYFDHSFIQ